MTNMDVQIAALAKSIRKASIDTVGQERFVVMTLIIPERDMVPFAEALEALPMPDLDALAMRDHLREAFKPFAEYMDGPTFATLPDHLQITPGSSMARAQLVVSHFRNLAHAVKQLTGT